MRKFLPYLEALFAVTVWGANFIATKIALREASPASIVWLRFGMGVLILGLAVWQRRQFTWPERREWGNLALLGFLGVTFHQWLQATGLQTAAATTTAWIVAAIPVFTALLGWAFLHEKLGWPQMTGIVLATIGTLVIVSHGDLTALARGGFGTPGDFLILVSAVNWAVFSVLSRDGLQKYPAALMMFYVMLFGWGFSAIWLFGLGPGLGEIPHFSAQGWNSLIALGVFGSGLAYIAWYDSLKALPASQLSVFIYIEPLVTMLTAALLLSETMSLVSLAGGGLTLLGVTLVNWRK